MSLRGKLLFFGIAAALAILDLASKRWAFEFVATRGEPSALHHGEKAVTVVPGFFYLTRVWNPGGIWGIAQVGLKSTALVIFRAVAIPAILYLMLRTAATERLLLTAFSLFCAGAVGNLYDNLFFEEGVRDFLDFWLIGERGYHWPTFNVADSCILSGVILVIAEMVFGRKQAKAPQAA